MSSPSFYTDRTQGARPRVQEDIPADVWRGLVGLVVRRINDGSLAKEFPDRDCSDFPDVIIGTDTRALETALETLIPDLRRTRDLPPGGHRPTPLLDPLNAPPTPVALDVIDFVAQHVADPVRREPHPWMQHEHLGFNQDSRELGQEKFRSEVELIFSRNGIAF